MFAKDENLFRGLRVLVVDDDTAIRNAHVRVLTLSGCLVEAVNDGIAGWRALRVKGFDLLIADRDLPKLSGLNLVTRVRFARLFLPIIMTSGPLCAKEPARPPWLQLSATLYKPFAPAQLMATVHAVMRAHHAAKVCPRPDICFPLRVLQKSVSHQGGSPAPARMRGLSALKTALGHPCC